MNWYEYYEYKKTKRTKNLYLSRLKGRKVERAIEYRGPDFRSNSGLDDD